MIQLKTPTGEFLQLPNRLSGLVPVEILPLEQLYSVYRDHNRLKVFALKGCKCVQPGCDRVGVYLIKTFQPPKGKNLGGYHVDLYDKDFMLMNVDHRIPKSIGGKSNLENLFPMCYEHNFEKKAKPAEY